MRCSFCLINFLAVPSLLYGCEIWTLKQRDLRRLKTAEMKFMICIAGYSLLDIEKIKVF